MIQRLAGFSLMVSKGCEKLINYWNSIHYRETSDADPSVLFLSGSRIINGRKSPKFIKLGSDTIIRGELFVFAHDGFIEIGKNCYVGEGTRIWSASNITIGDQVLISHNVNIHDTNGHPISSDLRHKHFLEILKNGHPKDGVDIASRPVRIDNNVWIGFNSVILKGVIIGEGAIIGANSVVTHDVPSWTIVAGNPAKVIREIPENER